MDHGCQNCSPETEHEGKGVLLLIQMHGKHVLPSSISVSSNLSLIWNWTGDENEVEELTKTKCYGGKKADRIEQGGKWLLS